MPDLLVEFLSEEMPARLQARAADDLARLATEGLVEAGLAYAHAAAFSTPRRLALAVEGLPAESPATREERKGPRTDAPDKALEGFLRSTGLTRDRLEARDDRKGQSWFAVIERPGRPAADIVAEVLERTAREFPWPKSMRWGESDFAWIRPLRSILCILSDEAGAEVVPLEIGGIRAGDATEGHRFMDPGQVRVASFDDYEGKLKARHVMLRAEERAEHIRNDAANLAFAQGMEIVEDRGLLAEVAGLVEWPVALIGDIGEEFLDLPPEVLRTSMREHQKFFSVRDPGTGRIGKFVTVANLEAADRGETILRGNGKVLSARLADARFFWENDLRVARSGKMAPWLAKLEDVTFHARLGSVADQARRIEALGRDIATTTGADPDLVAKAANCAKADLASEMVYEFPELQGTMGRYYCNEAGTGAEVAAAVAEHYAPLGPGDGVPGAPVSVALALADKLDKLAGFWLIDEKPTGSKDPFALRRAALGVVRILVENDLRVNLGPLLHDQAMRHLNGLLDRNAAGRDEYAFGIAKELRDAIEGHWDSEAGDVTSDGEVVFAKGKPAGDGDFLVETALRARRVHSDLLGYIHDRLKVHLRDEGVRHDVIDASLAMPGSDDIALLVKRAEALSAVLGTDDGANLLQGFKRANNILAQAEEGGGVERSDPSADLAEDPAETALFEALDRAGPGIASAMEREEFGAAMEAMAALRAPVDAFFEAVQVNADDEALRRNRLNLLRRVRATCLQVADLSRVEG